MLNEFLKDIATKSEEQSVEPPITHASTLKLKLLEKFGDDLGYFPSGKQLIVHAADANPASTPYLNYVGNAYVITT